MAGRWFEENKMADFISNPAVMETFVDILVCAVPIWVAVMIGLVIGWSWRPRWTGLVFLGVRSKFRFIWTAPPGFGARRFWLAFTALSAFFSVGRRLWFNFQGSRKEEALTQDQAGSRSVSGSVPVVATALESDVADGSSGEIRVDGNQNAEKDSVTGKDLEHLLHLLNGKGGELVWQSLMERSTSNMTYQAWRHEPEVGPIMYRSKTIFEDATPELVRDFFWDDEFRPKWDPMLAYVKILEECPHTGMMTVHWIKKFPFFCSDREYIIGRRIWEAGRNFYCVTKGVPYPDLPRRDKPRRVDLYFSSWIIKPVQSRKGDGQLSACEVTLIHYEDMGIPKDVAKLGVRHGMWGTVKKLHGGFRSYETARNSDAPLTRCALLARITTKLSSIEGNNPLEPGVEDEERDEIVETERQKGHGGIDWRWVAVGGAVAIVCGLKTGLIGKAVLVGVGQRVARRRSNSR